MDKNFKEFKEKVSIIEAAVALGYKFDPSKGRPRPNFVLTDDRGNETDRIIITNPTDSANQGYWHRIGTHGNTKGDLITFVKEHINDFQVSGRNEVDTINNILTKLANEVRDEFNKEEFLKKNGIREAKPFDLKRYKMDRILTANEVSEAMHFFRQRGITQDTLEQFKTFIVRITDTQAKYKYKNLAFPYRKPGSREIEGFEVRGLNGYKGKTEGSNSASAVWWVDFTKNNPLNVKNVYFAESAFDIMAFYQANKARLDLATSAFVSVGGSFSEEQVVSLMKHYASAKPIDCFDNDLPGRIYGIRMMLLMEGRELKVQSNEARTAQVFQVGDKTFEIPNDEVSLTSLRKNLPDLRYKAGEWKAPKDFKDWNDAVMNKPWREVDAGMSKAQHLEELREKRTTTAFKR